MKRYILTKERTDIPAGYRNLTEEEVAREFLKLDTDKNYFITKNEWMLNFLAMWAEDVAELDKEAPDAVMSRIECLSDEFDKYDLDGNKYIDFIEYKNFILNNLLVSED